MKKRMSKLIFVLLICICMFGGSMTVHAATEYVDGYLRYTVADGSVTITGYNGKEAEVTVPSKIAGTPVNVIAAGAFSNADTVTKINLPDTIMTIEEGAFSSDQVTVYGSDEDSSLPELNETAPSQTEQPDAPSVQESTKDQMTQSPVGKPSGTEIVEGFEEVDIEVVDDSEIDASDSSVTDNESVENVNSDAIDTDNTTANVDSIGSVVTAPSDSENEEADNVNLVGAFDKATKDEGSGNKVLYIVIGAVIVAGAAVGGVVLKQKVGKKCSE